MKTVLIILCLVLISFINAYGQWFYKKYHVRDIDSLSKVQLQESYKDAKSGAGISAGMVGLGGVLLVLSIAVPPDTPADPNFYQQMFSEKDRQNVNIVLSSAIIVGSTFAALTYLGRMARIKVVTKRNFPPAPGKIDVSPAVFPTGSIKSIQPGIKLTYRF